MLLVSSKYLSALIQYGGDSLPLLFAVVNGGLLNRYTPPGDSGEIGGKMRSLGPRSRTLGHKGVAEKYLVHLNL